MRVISGIFRGKKLQAADESITRPTSDRAKEGLFNILNHYLLSSNKSWPDICFFDVFAGSGGVGIEALSRGAKTVVLFENNKDALKCIYSNINKMTGISIIVKDACLPPPAKQVADILFFDPPYGKGLWQKSLIQFQKQGYINQETLIIVETDKLIQEEIPVGFDCFREQSYGRNVFLFLKISENE